MSILVESKQDRQLHLARDEVFLETLKSGGNVELCVRGQSMYPTIKDYDILGLKSTLNSPASLADIVLIVGDNQDEPNYFIHRLVRIKEGIGAIEFYTKGDNSAGEPEGPFKTEQIIGKVISIKRRDSIIGLQLKLKGMFSYLIAFISLHTPNLFKALNYISSLTTEIGVAPFDLLKRLRCTDTLAQNGEQLLTIISLGNFDEVEINRAINLIKQGIRWNYFCDMAIANGRTALIAKGLNTLKRSVDIPDFVLEKLNTICLATIAGTVRSHSQLIELLKNFHKENIMVIPLKGTILAQYIYKDIAMRGASCDIDLLVREEDKPKACVLLENLGYQLQPSREIKAWQWQCDFSKPDQYPIDLHWDLTLMNRSKQRIEGLWQAINIVNLDTQDGKINYYAWDNETLLLYLCIQIVNSCGYRNLRYFLDLNALIKNSRPINWQVVIDDAQRFRLPNSVYACLIKTKELLNTEIPKFVFDGLKPRLVKGLFIGLFLSRSVIMHNNLRRKIMDSFLSYIFLELLEAASFKDFLKIIKRVMFPPAESLESQSKDMDWASLRIKSNTQYVFCCVRRILRGLYKSLSLLFR